MRKFFVIPILENTYFFGSFVYFPRTRDRLSQIRIVHSFRSFNLICGLDVLGTFSFQVSQKLSKQIFHHIYISNLASLSLGLYNRYMIQYGKNIFMYTILTKQPALTNKINCYVSLVIKTNCKR